MKVAAAAGLAGKATSIVKGGTKAILKAVEVAGVSAGEIFQEHADQIAANIRQATADKRQVLHLAVQESARSDAEFPPSFDMDDFLAGDRPEWTCPQKDYDASKGSKGSKVNRVFAGFTARFQELYAAEQETYRRDNPDHLPRAQLEKTATTARCMDLEDKVYTSGQMSVQDVLTLLFHRSNNSGTLRREQVKTYHERNKGKRKREPDS